MLVYALTLTVAVSVLGQPVPAEPAEPVKQAEPAPEHAEPEPPAAEPEPSVPSEPDPLPQPAPPAQTLPAPVPEPEPEAAPDFPCERLEFLWTGPYAGEPGAEGDPDRPASLEDAARVYAEYLRYLFLSPEYAVPCPVPQDPLIATANACAAIAHGRGTASTLAGVLAGNPEAVNAVWMLDAVVRYDQEYAQAWRNYFGPGPAFRVIDLMFDALPREGPVVYEGLLRLTETAQGVYANYIASRFINLFANEPQWVLINAERFIPFGPALRLIFCNYLTIPQREALVIRYGEFPYSDAQVAIIELVGCL